MKLTCHLISTILLLSTLCLADELVLKNGNHLTGTIVKLDDNKLVLKTEFADTINIKWDAIANFSASSPLVLETPDNKITVTTVERRDGTLVANAGSSQPVTIESASLKSLRSQGEQTEYEKSLRPGLREGWGGGANLGLALAKGNSDTLSLSTGLNLARATLNDKTSLYATSVYAKDNINHTITANAIQGGVRYDHNLNKKLFAFISGDFENNDLQKLDLRSILNGGLGWHAINRSSTVLDFFGGLSWTHEKYGTGLTNNIFSPSAGEELTQKLTANTVFKEKAFFFPYVTGGQAGEYRFAFDSGLNTKISKWLAWQTTLSDRYVSNPLPGTKGNDLLLSTGLGITLAGKK
jgi:putative salt-induced outer membrane protein